MSERLTFVLNGESMLEYDRGKVLPNDQIAYLDRLDEKMNAGIQLDGAFVEQPNQLQRAQFMALQLLIAVRADQDAQAAAACAYLARRVPDLHQVRASDGDEGTTLDLVFDRAYSPETKIEFFKP